MIQQVHYSSPGLQEKTKHGAHASGESYIISK